MYAEGLQGGGHQVKPLLNVQKKRVSFNFQKKSYKSNLITIIFTLQTYITIFGRVSAFYPYSSKMPMESLDCLHLWCSKTPCPSVNLLTKIPCETYGAYDHSNSNLLNTLEESREKGKLLPSLLQTHTKSCNAEPL